MDFRMLIARESTRIRRIPTNYNKVRALAHHADELLHGLALQPLIMTCLREHYSGVLSRDCGKSPINCHEFHISSQNGEDGILLYLFSLVGTTDSRCFEFGIETGRECNTANLIRNFGWKAVLLDGNPQGVQAASNYYQGFPVTVATRFITAENINQIMDEFGFSGEFDLLSIDIDGNDYYVWQAMSTARPRVVVVEYNGVLGPEPAVAVPYDVSFSPLEKHATGWYFGASLSALTNLAHTKGYMLVGVDSAGVNAFFVRRDVALGKIDEVQAIDAYYPLSARYLAIMAARAGIALPSDPYEVVRHLPLVRV